MAGDREALPIPVFGSDEALDDFKPRRAQERGRLPQDQRAIDAVSSFPSREGGIDGQLNLKGPKHVLDRFKAMCKTERRPYYDMLDILMDEYDRANRQQ